ncbi:MAG: ferrochelatase [Halieaceae bacterium]|nr:ferrochelatase [Halieaceae bacterium]
MEPVDTPIFSHQESARIGVLVTNLGTPAAPTAAALKPYLKQFLSDRRVVDLPRLLWWPILNLIILNIRPKKSAEAYSEVWSDEGSPLFVHTRRQTDLIREQLEARLGDQVVVDFGFRYGNPSIPDGIESLKRQGARKIVVLPLYPQYSATTVASTFDAVAEDFQKRRWLPDFRFISHYHDHPGYIEALAASVRRHWAEHGRADKLLMSFHGIPKRYFDNGDPYFCECHKTTRLLAEALSLNENEYQMVFQSRFGREEWLQPYTDETLETLADEGVKSVQVICPGFSADCLETLEEIALQYKEVFLEAGGDRFDYIPALNEDDAHIAMLSSLVEDNMAGWLQAAPPVQEVPETSEARERSNIHPIAS